MEFLLIVLLSVVVLIVAVALLLFRPDTDPAAVEKKYAGPDSHFVTVDGLRMHYTDRGSGLAVVMIHGITSNHRSWSGWVRELSESYRMIAVDLPGHGLTGPDPAHRYSWAELAERLAGLVDAIGLERFVLCGNSLGGAVSLSYALAHPERLQALVLVDSIGPPLKGRRPPSLEAASLPLLGRLLIYMSAPPVVRRVFKSTFGDPGRVTELEVEIASDLLHRAGNRKACREILLEPHDTTLAERLGGIKLPVLILWGDRDSWVRPGNADWFAQRLPNATLVRFPELGHLPMTEDPVTTAAALRAFIEELPQPRV